MAEADGQASDFATADVSSRPNLNETSSQAASTSVVHPPLPSVSVTDNGLSKRPRDARLLHMILASLGVTAYQERVPQQIMDFAYRYTSSVLSDALHLTTEGYGSSGPGQASGRGANAGNQSDLSSVTLSSLRLSIASRTHYQFNPTLPKEFYNEIAQERNRVALPAVGREWGLRLPPEQYCLTGVGWGLKEEWDSDGENLEGEEKDEDQNALEQALDEDLEGNEGEDGNERMEDFFGEDFEHVEKDLDMDGA